MHPQNVNVQLKIPDDIIICPNPNCNNNQFMLPLQAFGYAQSPVIGQGPVLVPIQGLSKLKCGECGQDINTNQPKTVKDLT